MYSAAIFSHELTGAYPERHVPKESWINQLGIKAVGPIIQWKNSKPKIVNEFVDLVNGQGLELQAQSDEELSEAVAILRQRLRETRLDDIECIAQAFALIRETAHRKINMRHFDVQLVGGLIMMQGMVAEMETGEGKTLTATLPACTAALCGLPVHIITVNDYLVQRDAAWIGPVYQALGLTVGTIVAGMGPDERRKAYACDITYCTNKEIAFDYLKDRITLGKKRTRLRLQLEKLHGQRSRIDQLLMRGLCFAIVDEADSVLIDEAKTPLIISGQGAASDEERVYKEALDIAKQLNVREEFLLLAKERNVQLTEQGKVRIENISDSLGGIWRGKQRREELVAKALAAIHLYILNKQYLLKDGKVQIIDEYTGRVMPDRSWELGLHQLIEAKEGCALTARKETLARISYQRFFRRYVYLAGMTGTAKEVARELWAVYRLNVVRVPTNRPVRRNGRPTQIHFRPERKWEAIAESILRMHEQGRPVLVGTRSVEASEQLSALLDQRGVEHCVLNARQDENEAHIIEQAGQAGRITVATNMAGRGTDIKLGAGVADNGGLHVILTEMHEAKRIDRQLIGRCGRQGDIGSYEMILSLEDELFVNYTNKALQQPASQLAKSNRRWSQFILLKLMKRGQRFAERHHRRIRHELLKMDDQLDVALAFSGRLE